MSMDASAIFSAIQLVLNHTLGELVFQMRQAYPLNHVFYQLAAIFQQLSGSTS